MSATPSGPDLRSPTPPPPALIPAGVRSAGTSWNAGRKRSAEPPVSGAFRRSLETERRNALDRLNAAISALFRRSVSLSAPELRNVGALERFGGKQSGWGRSRLGIFEGSAEVRQQQQQQQQQRQQKRQQQRQQRRRTGDDLYDARLAVNFQLQPHSLARVCSDHPHPVRRSARSVPRAHRAQQQGDTHLATRCA